MVESRRYSFRHRRQILQKHGIHSKHAAKAAERRAKAAAIARKKGKPFNKAQRVAAEKKAEEAKAAAAEAAAAASADG